MKKLFIFSPLLFLLIIITFSSFSNNEEILTPASRVKLYVLQELETTRDRIKDLHKAVEDKDVERMKQALIDARVQYKMIEFYLESYESSYTKFINGQPVPWLEFVGSDTELTKPGGFQVLAEMIYESDSLDFENIKLYTVFLNNELLYFRTTIEINPTGEALIFLGLKYGVTGIETVTLPAFDCEITQDVARESISSLETIYNVLDIYLDEYKNKPIAKTIRETQKIIRNGQKYLRPNGKYLDFETLDRLTFVKTYLQPIGSNIVDVFNNVKIEEKNYTLRSFRYYNTHLNSKARNTYDPDFIDRMATGHKGYYDIDNDERLNPEIVALGKKLFNDKRLSGGNKLSCSTCHEEHLGFADGQKGAFTNVEGVFQHRNSPSIVYSAYDRRLFMDFRAHSLEDQIVHVVHNPLEFNTTFDEMIGKLVQDTALVNEFVRLFPKDWKKPIKEFTIRKALGEYVRSLPEFNSEFDAYMRGEIDDLPAEVKRGYNLFNGKAKCGTCHFAPTYAGTVPPLYRESDSEVLGTLEKWDTINPVLASDSGRYGFQSNPIYIRSFKIPTVRNVELTGPYLHHGAFEDLESVMDFYNRGGGAGMGLDVPNQTLDEKPLNLNDQEIQDIIAFMHSLTDRHLLEKHNKFYNKSNRN